MLSKGGLFRSCYKMFGICPQWNRGSHSASARQLIWWWRLSRSVLSYADSMLHWQATVCVFYGQSRHQCFFFLQQPPHELQGSWALCVAHGHCMLNNKLRQFLVEFLVEQPGLTCSVVNMFPTALLYQHLGHLISLQVAESQFCIWV